MSRTTTDRIIRIRVNFDFFSNPRTGINLLNIDITTLGGKIRQARINKKILISILAKKIGVSSVTLSRWELNKCNPRKKNKEFIKLQKILELDI